jgi:hypothetical protein
LEKRDRFEELERNAQYSMLHRIEDVLTSGLGATREELVDLMCEIGVVGSTTGVAEEELRGMLSVYARGAFEGHELESFSLVYRYVLAVDQRRCHEQQLEFAFV